MKKFFIFFLSTFLLSNCSSILYSGNQNQFYFKKKNYTWKAFQTKDYIAYYQPNSIVEKNLLSTEKKITKGIYKAKEFTGIQNIKTPIYYFIVNDKNDFKKLTGLNHTAISYSKSNTIIESYFLIGESHEVVHLLSNQNWGNTHSWISEGLSVYSDKVWNNQDIDILCHQLLKKNQLIPLKKLFKNNKFNTFNSQICYPQSGSLIKYLITVYGWDKFIEFWRKTDIYKVYHINENALENQWIEYLKTLHKS